MNNSQALRCNNCFLTEKNKLHPGEGKVPGMGSILCFTTRNIRLST